MAYSVVGRRVVRDKDGKTIALAYDKKHAKAIAKRFNAWSTMGWPYQIPKEK